jgi:hypothetical protein
VEVHREQQPLVPAQAPGLALERAHDDLRPNRPAVRADDPGPQAPDGGPLVDRHPDPLHHPRQPAGEPGGMDGRAVRGEDGATQARHPDPLARLVGAQPPAIGTVQVREGLELRPQPVRLERRGRHLQAPAAREVRVDPLGPAHALDLPHGLAQRRRHRPRAVDAEPLGDDRRRDGELGRGPAAVAAGGAEPRHPPLEHGDPQGRVGLGQVVGGPQPGEPAADDGDVDLRLARERRARGEIVPAGLQPEAEGVPRVGVHRS